MDLHNRFLLFPTLNISTLQAVSNQFENESDIYTNHLIRSYDHELIKETLDTNELEICRMLLCYKYQLIFRDIGKDDEKCITADAERTCSCRIEAIFPAQHVRSTTESSVLRDILILQMVLYCNTVSVKQSLQNFLNLCDAYIVNSDTRALFMRVLGYSLESLRLYQFHYNDVYCSKGELKILSSMCLNVVKSWTKAKEDSEWGILTSMLPILTNTFTPEYILYPLWDYTLNEISDLKEFLTMLSIMADTCFVLLHSGESTYIHCHIFSNSTFWLRILEGLRSRFQQYRKQALYIMKKATDSFDKINISNLELTKAEVTPFICNKPDDSALAMAKVKQTFFLVLEVLEEKQYHLVAPAVTHITSLEKANIDHRSCKCFDIVWLQCIFEKVLQHENCNIVKWGISRACKLDDYVYNDQFLKLFLTVLNNSFIYECQPNENSPEVLKGLSTFLRNAEKNGANLLSRFLKAASEVAWGPVAIFYIMHTLRTISHERTPCNYWQATELNAIKTLVKTSLNMHSHVLRAASQIELLRAIPSYISKIDDLTLLADVLAAFHSGGSLTNEKPVWSIIVTWLRTALTKEGAVNFMEDICARYLCEDVPSKVNPRALALMLFLLCDTKLSCEAWSVERTLSNSMASLNGITMRPYADIRSTINVVEVVSHFLNFITPCEFTKLPFSFMALLRNYVNSIVHFFIKNIKAVTMKMTYEDYTRYTAILSSFIANVPSIVPSKEIINDYMERFQNEGIRLLKGTQRRLSVPYLYGLSILYLSQDIAILPQAKIFYTECLLNTDSMITALDFTRSDTVNLQGKIASEYYLLLSKLTRQYLSSTPVCVWISTETLLDNLSRFLSSGTEIVSEVATILTIIIDNGAIRDANDTKGLQQIFELCWRWTFVSEKNNIFWTAIQNLTRVIINNNFFLLPDATKFMSTFVDQLTEEGDASPKLKRILLSAMEGLDMCNLIKLTEPLLHCLFHVSVLRRDKRVENHAHLFIAEHLRKYYLEHILAMDHNNDAAVRTLVTILFHRIVSNSEFNCATTMVPFILEMLEKYKNKRYFNNSYLHKLKHRLMQVLLILEPSTSGDLVALLLKKLCDLIFVESNQHSVRLMQEWLIIRIIRRNTNLHDKLWIFFAETIEKRPGCTISIASIVYHVAQLLSDNSQKSFIQTALPYVSQCCLGQQFNMRLYNQFILVRLYELLKENNGDVSAYNGIYQAAVASLLQGSSMKNSAKIEDDFYFSSFHPVNDYSLQTIYFELPRLTNMSRDEWISPNVFEAFAFKQNDNHPLRLYNVDSSLADTKTSMYLTKSPADDTESLASDVETYFEGLYNMQKKLDPSKTRVLSYGVFEAMRDSINQQDLLLNEEGLIVVASFVSRPPNLGGIARTCEIFGVKTLVIANLDCAKDKEFQNLSVSAERWINILQVKPHKLQEYLLDKKDAGWSIVAAEQTTNSINLLEAKFEKKTILVLGNEKDGIPANFIPLFNTCVEIPQIGVIRSLNVHVSAAICIWQYASQHILK